MNFEVLILGSDQNAYFMARNVFEAYNKKAFLIAKKPLSYTSYSNILNISYEEYLWNEKVFLRVLYDFRQNHEGKILLISTNETYTEFICKNKKLLKDKYIFNYPEYEVTKSLMDKKIFYTKYKNTKLSLPKTYFINLKENRKLNLDIEHPLILKPSNVINYNHIKFNGKKKIYKVNTKKELDDVVKILKNSGYKDEFILQEYISGNDDKLFDAVIYSNSKGKVEFISFAQVGLQERTDLMIGNTSVLINGINTTKGDIKKEIYILKEFIESINYTGIAQVDIKYDKRDNTFKVLEINARQGRGSYYLTALNKNLVKVLIDDLIYKRENKFEILNSKVLMTFVPEGIIKKYIKDEKIKQEIFSLWKTRVNPMIYEKDKNILRKFMICKRKYNYYKEYKKSQIEYLRKP